MKRTQNQILRIFILLVAFQLFAQSGREYRRSAVMRGNLVKSVFGNWGVIGQPAEKGARGAWIYDNNGYVGDVSPLVGAEITVNGVTFHSVEVCPVDRPTLQHEQSPSGQYWGWEPLRGYFNENQESIALFSDPLSWPSFWPDKMGDSEDPGWSGSWNGIFGKQTTASEECFFIMNDNGDVEFNEADNNVWNVNFKPNANDPSRNGLGLEMKVRGMQWSDFLAQDCIFWLYEITNTSTTDYDKVVFGMLVGTYVGVTSTEDYREYNDDYSFFDVEKDLTYTADFDDNANANPRWHGDVGVVGYAFLESPGNHYDGIDNDGDADANLLIPATGPFFTEDDFQLRTLSPGDEVVLIDNNYNRTVVTVPNTESTVTTRGANIKITPGVTQLAEGNVLLVEGDEVINPNAYDGIDNDLDGVIDENFYLHYRQIRKDQDGNILIDKLAPVRHVDYFSGLGENDLMIDERREDGIDNDGDWNPEFDDVGADGLLATNDMGEGDGLPTHGEPNFDETDVDESDQIGLTSFEYFTPAREFSMADDEDLWRRLSPGFFEVPESIVNNKPERGEDGDFLYSSGYFPLRAGETQRFSLALVYGDGGGPEVEIDDLLKNRQTVQNIYDSDYRFPPAPQKPTLKIVPGDGRVTLYWDRKSEKSFDPVLKKYDFEGYKIYKATDHNFNEVFEVTDADGTPIAYKPLIQYDLNDGIKGYFHAGTDLFQQARGASFYLGKDSGLQHSFVDEDVENGRRYFYAVVAYDQGDEESDIFPKENDKRIDILPSGEVRTFQNTAVVIPNAEVAGYQAPLSGVELTGENIIGTGAIAYQIVDEQAVNGHEYLLTFRDTGNDGADNDGDWDVLIHDVGTDGKDDTNDADGTEHNGLPDSGEPNVDHLDPDEYFVPVTTDYSILDKTGAELTFWAQDTLPVNLPHQHLVTTSIRVMDGNDQDVAASRYRVDPETGRIRGAKVGDLRHGESFLISYQYYPVYQSPYMFNSPYVDETLDSDIFDGLQLSIRNDWTIERDRFQTRWSNSDKSYNFSMDIIDTQFGAERLLGYRHPVDFRIEFYDSQIDSSAEIKKYFVTPIPVNFRLFNLTDQKYSEFIFIDTDFNEMLTPFDELIFVERGPDDELLFTWDLYFTSTKDDKYQFDHTDTLFIHMKKPFRKSDQFIFSTEVASASQDSAKGMLDQVKVVPNPYIAATTHEIPLPPAVTSGRGERKIDFIHVPVESKVHIFTVRGDHVVTLQHEGGIFEGAISWNLKTKENLDVAGGVYFYVVESDVGNQRGKLAIIK